MMGLALHLFLDRPTIQLRNLQHGSHRDPDLRPFQFRPG
jgi:hypothetical protein